ncbi:hypothetical protein SDC9_200439 [bioreactor metagenome]|uniref:Uncharacterized protein n=1 Tax=bioreactor metagenome TaxID=1076179 RepID=A0A645INZ6_9ZZZZ
MCNGIIALALAVAVHRLVLVAHPKKRGFQNVESARQNQIFKVRQKVCHQQIADMKAIGIGIGCDDDLAVPEPLHPVLNAQGDHHVVQLGILVDFRLLLAVDIHNLAPEAEHRLGHDITRLGDGPRSTIALGQEDHGLFTLLLMGGTLA